MKPGSELTELSRCLATEISTVANRIVDARAQDLLRALEQARTAIEAAAAPLDERLNVSGIADEDLQRIRERLSSNPALEAIRRQLQLRTESTEQLKATLAAARNQLDTARRDLEVERAEFESTIEELRREHAVSAGEQAIAYTSLPLDALLTVFNSLKRATSGDQILETVVDGLAREFSRVALFRVQGLYLEGVRQIGFTFENDIAKTRVPATGDSLLSRSIASGRLEAFFPTLQVEPISLPFAGTPSCAMAVPFATDGSVTAVIYADDSDSPEFATAAPQSRAKFAELLHQHATYVLLSVGGSERAALAGTAPRGASVLMMRR
jgi:hypothetical protein